MSLSPMAQQRLDKLLNNSRDMLDNVLGYPCSTDFDHSELAPFFSVVLNNIGDPFQDGTWRVDSREMEREVLEFYAELYRAPKDNWWGYVTGGGTEGNLYGMYLARELYPKGVVYYSRESHYSAAKNLHFLGMRHIMLRSNPDGSMDLEDLRETLRIHRDAPPIIFANIGTTVTEGRDDIHAIKAIFEELAIPQHYIHSDAALSGGYLPFVDGAPAFDFADGVDSISVSGHKFIGSPFPCGLVFAKKQHVDRIGRAIAYIGNIDTTVTGSRSGHAPLLLWHRIQSLGYEGMKKRATDAIELAEWTVQELKAIGIAAWRNPAAITVVFPTVPSDLQTKYQLASTREHSHICCMPGLTREKIQNFINDYQIILEPKSQ